MRYSYNRYIKLVSFNPYNSFTLKDLIIADSYNEPNFNIDNYSFPRGRGGRRHGIGRTG